MGSGKKNKPINKLNFMQEEDCLKLYREDVRKLVKRFKTARDNKGWKVIEKELIEKREKWYEENKKFLKLKGSDVEKAYQLILMKM